MSKPDIYMHQLRVMRAETEKEVLEAFIAMSGNYGWGNEAPPLYWEKIRPYLTKQSS